MITIILDLIKEDSVVLIQILTMLLTQSRKDETWVLRRMLEVGIWS